MPIQLAVPYTYGQERFATIPEEDESEEFSCCATEEKNGDLVMVTPDNRRQRVQMMIYRTSLEHFAVVYPQRTICQPLGVLNLKNTTCQRLTDGTQTGVVLRQRGFDSIASLTFICESSREVDSWMSGLSAQPSSFIRQSSLPIVEEDEEF